MNLSNLNPLKQIQKAFPSYRKYRTKVGPPQHFNTIGLLQATALSLIGLRAGDTVLDVGCGCLRGGKWIIPVCTFGCYYSIEPDRELFEKGIENELTHLNLSPRQIRKIISHNWAISDFLTHSVSLKREFDYIMAQSILTHTSEIQARLFFENCYTNSHGSTRLIFTAFTNMGVTTLPQKFEPHLPARWKEEELTQVALENGWHLEKMKLPHPTDQTWFYGEKLAK